MAIAIFVELTFKYTFIYLHLNINLILLLLRNIKYFMALTAKDRYWMLMRPLAIT